MLVPYNGNEMTRFDTKLWTDEMIDSQIRNSSENCVATDGANLATRFPGYTVPSLPKETAASLEQRFLVSSMRSRLAVVFPNHR